MNIYYEIPEAPAKFKNPVITIGTFDGVHLGHREIIKKLVKIADEKKSSSIVLTFDPHPRKIINPATPPRILTTTKEKIKAISDLGIENIIILKFTKEIAGMHAIDFLNDIIIKKTGMRHLVVGYDHAFGKDREGDFPFMTQISKLEDFSVTRVDPLDYHSKPVSSTWIRAEIEDGNILLANSLLGREYSLAGTVARGNNIGTGLGYPTANIVPDDLYKIIPKDGVYAVRVSLDNVHSMEGMLNIGTNPTFSRTERTIEVNIFDFNKDIYGKNIEIFFYDRIRDEVKFGSPEEISSQLARDKTSARLILKKSGIYN